jgi:ribosome maturation factor RimP
MIEKKLLDRITKLVHNILQDNGIELIDIICRREGGGNVLRILADTESGITIDECAKVNELISEVLDKDNLIDESYLLEVSSPGLDRPLKTKADFLRQKGKKIRIHTYAPVEDRKEFIGVLEGFDGKDISILTEKGARISIALDKVASAKLHF